MGPLQEPLQYSFTRPINIVVTKFHPVGRIRDLYANTGVSYIVLLNYEIFDVHGR